MKQVSVGNKNPKVLAKSVRIDPGDYSYPFEFSLPIDLEPSVSSPGSFHTTYSLRVELKLSKFKSNPLVDTFLLYIHKPSLQLLAPTFNAKLQRGIIHKDRVFLTCLPASQTLQLFEALKIDISIRNESRKDITRLIVGLEQKVIKNKKQKLVSLVYQTDVMLQVSTDQ